MLLFVVSSQYLVQCLITGYSLNSGPERIRTPDILSAIEARSQLRYRPFYKANRILPEAICCVKQGFGCKIGKYNILRGNIMAETNSKPTYRISDLHESERPRE